MYDLFCLYQEDLEPNCQKNGALRCGDLLESYAEPIIKRHGY